MDDRIFSSIDISDYISSQISDAALVANSIPDSKLASGEASQLADEAINAFTFKVATLKPAERKGKRRVEERQSGDYGRRAIEVTVIDVTIPFDGYPKSFEIKPSICSVVQCPARVSREGLVATFYDDAQLDKNVDTFIRQTAENLDRLRLEMQSIRALKLEKAITILNGRIAKIKERQALDATRSFPIE